MQPLKFQTMNSAGLNRQRYIKVQSCKTKTKTKKMKITLKENIIFL